jgi:sulfur relay (sulfurtransferase) complex TusBCD TusD component (DsrE family)
MTVGFLLRTGPYTSQNIDTVYHLAKKLLSKGNGVKLFLYEDGLIALNKNIKSPQERNLAEMMAELASLGADVKGCGTCASFRGLKKDDIIEGAKLGGMAVLVNYIGECDRFLGFGF